MATRPSLRGPRHLAVLAVAALGFVFAAQASWAQADRATPGSGGAPHSEVGPVVVHAPRHHPQPGIPPEKAKIFAAEAARDEAWREYRNSIPAHGAGTLERSKDYPGLHSYLQP